jgi:Peptidase family M23
VIARTAAAGFIIAAVFAPSAGARLTEPPERIPDKQLFFVPLNGNLGSPFGPRWGRFHDGIDIEGWAHTQVYAALSGEVVRVGWLGGYEGYGLVVKIRHSREIVTMYAHLARSSSAGRAAPAPAPESICTSRSGSTASSPTPSASSGIASGSGSLPAWIQSRRSS